MSNEQLKLKIPFQVNIPFTMLYDKYLEIFIQLGLNPEVAIDAEALDRFSLYDFSETAKKLKEYNLRITFHGPFIDLSPGSPDSAIRQTTKHRFEQLLRLIPIFQPKTVVCHGGYDRSRYGFGSFKELWIEKSLKMWKWLSSRIHDEGSILMLENVYEHNPDEILVFFENIERNHIGFCLDTGHQAAFGRVSLEIWLEKLNPYLGQIHLHDNNGEEDEHLPVGQGSIDFQPLFENLKQREKMPIITIEPHKEDDLWPSLEYLKTIF